MKISHLSLRWDRPARDVALQMERFIRLRPDIITVTEATRFRRVLRADGYRTIHPQGYPELAALVHEDLDVVDADVLQLSDRGIPRRGGEKPYALIVTLADGTRIVVVHLPSGVEGRNGLRRNEQAAVWRDCMRRLRTWVAHQDGAVVIVGDFNLSVARRWVRRWYARWFGDFTLVAPSRGTYRKRVIDYALLRGLRPHAARTLHNPASDHRAVLLEPKEAPVAKDQTYPGADTTSQWFADNYPGAGFDANCGVLHTTEGTSWPGYQGGATAPNVTALPDIAGKRLRWRQHFPIDMSSRALRNESGGVETNTLNAVQVELVGTCDPKHRRSWNGQGKHVAGRDYIYWPEAPAWALRELGEFLAWCHLEHGIALEGPERWLAYPDSYGRSPVRFTFAQWRNHYGWCGHQHVPENSHGDPGDIAFDRALAHARDVVANLQRPDTDTPTGEDLIHMPDLTMTELQKVIREEIHGALRNDGERQVVDLGEARVEDPDGERTALTLGRLLWATKDDAERALAELKALRKEINEAIAAAEEEQA